MLYRRTEYHISSSNSALFITVKVESKWNFVQPLRWYFEFYKRKNLTEDLRSLKIHYRIQFQGPILGGVIVVSTSLLRAPAVITDCRKLERMFSNVMTFVSNLVKIG
jgi:hypothetical protein